MADNKDGRERQARNAERRQRRREIEAAVARGDEPEPPVDESPLAYFETELESLSFPATGTEIIASVGDRELAEIEGEYTVADLLPDADAEQFETAADVQFRLLRPTVAEAMKQVVEATETLKNTSLGNSQRDAYERTFLELERADIVDDDEGIAVVRDWLLDRIEEKGEIPGSRSVRRRAAKYVREQGIDVRNDEWLGV